MLRKVLVIFLTILVTLGFTINDVEAKRFGGGRSFGVSRATSSFSRSSGLHQTPLSYGQKFSNPNRWFGPLAGLLTGGLLASLFMNHGLGSGLLSWLLVGGLLFVFITLLKNKKHNTTQFKQFHQDNHNNFARESVTQFMRNNNYHEPSQSYSAAVNNYPVGFDAPSFLREAKVQFIRLQAAYDKKNINDIREFTSPQVFAEIQLQLQERGNEENKTHVMSLQAELLNVETQSQYISGTEMETLVASVRFTGMIQEQANEPATAVHEIWHFRKEVANLNWIVVGVQQE